MIQLAKFVIFGVTNFRTITLEHYPISCEDTGALLYSSALLSRLGRLVSFPAQGDYKTRRKIEPSGIGTRSLAQPLSPPAMVLLLPANLMR